MSFVAQPYQRFVADLLTGLTGGVTREESLFTGPAATYSLGAHDALASTIDVFGQRNAAFLTFTRGVDYEYVPETGTILWKPNGRPPDDHSYFYVSYYRREASSSLTDRNTGSVTATLAEAFARELAVLHLQMERIYQSAFVELATGTSLDHVVALLGLTRKDPKFASGEVAFKRATPAPGDITIPSGTIVASQQGQTFETTDKRTLRKGQLTVTVPIRAQVEGSPGNVDAEAIKILPRPIFGIETVVNEAKTAFASQAETDEELRRRLQGTLERAGKATVDAIKYALIEQIPEISESNVQLSEDFERGLVEVKIGLESRGDPTLAGRIDDAIFSARPAGVKVTHNVPSDNPPGTGGGISRSEAVGDFGPGGEPPGTNSLPPEVRAPMPDGVLNLRIEVFIRLAPTNLTAAQKGSIEDAVRNAVADYVKGLPMGAMLVFNKLLGRVVAIDGVADAAMLVGAELDGAYVHFAGNLSTDGRKATIDDYHIYVGLMDQAVLIDMTVKVEPVAGSSLTAAAVAALIGQDGPLHASIAGDVAAYLASAHDAVRLAGVRDRLKPRLTAASLQFAEKDGLVMSATYDETHRLLNAVQEVPLEEQEVAALQKLTIKQKDALDG
jgi:uncharacterized phage protein gp47/JayE